jgi:hypothetical protein
MMYDKGQILIHLLENQRIRFLPFATLLDLCDFIIEPCHLEYRALLLSLGPVCYYSSEIFVH